MAQINKLTALQIKSAKPKDKEYRLSDGRGLYLRVYPNGTKSFVLILSEGKKTIKQTLGLTSEITLEQARNIADEKIALAKSIPLEYRISKLTFKEAFDEYILFKKEGWTPRMYEKVTSYHRLFYYKIDKMPLAEIRRKDILKMLESLIVRNKKEYFNSVKAILSVFYGWAVQKEYCEHNIMRDIETKYLFATRTHKHYPHLSEVKEVLKFKQALTDCRSHYNMKFMLMFQLYTAVRPNEARLATWDEFDFKKGIWTIPAHRMKMRKTHQVTLNKQILKALKEFKGDNTTGLCFKNMRGKPFNVHSPLAVLTYMDYKSVVSPHGFRGTFATIANELRAEHGFNNDIVQACLAHETQNQVAKAYNHATYEKERAKLLGWWGDKLGDIDFKRIKKTSVYN